MDLWKLNPLLERVWEHRETREGDLLKPRKRETKTLLGLAVGAGRQPLSVGTGAGTQTPSLDPDSHSGPGVVIWVLRGRCLRVSVSRLIWE